MDPLEAALEHAWIQHKAGNSEEALLRFRAIDSAYPGCVRSVLYQAAVLWDLGRAPEAEGLVLKALDLNPLSADAWNLHGLLCLHHKDLSRAKTAFLGALRVDPGHAAANANLAVLLSTGRDWEEAWTLRENWWDAMEQPRRIVPFPEWDGSPFPGRTLLLHGAQEGFGDMVFFARYASLAKARGGRVVLEAYPSLVPLLVSCPGVDEVIPVGTTLPEVDLQAVLSSLPGTFGTSLETVPCQVPYLSLPNPTEVPRRAELEARLAGAPGRKVGLVWAGDRNLAHDAARSIPPGQLRALGACRDITFVLLQKRDHGTPLPAPPEGISCLDLGDLLDDFTATSHVLGHLEALISVDTSVAHVAGALGLPVLLLLPHQAEWRWLRERGDSPWYPSFRLYRQSHRGDWASPLERVAADLSCLRSPGALNPALPQA